MPKERNGPAPEHAYNSTFHRNWHHFWRYSSGDIINDGVAKGDTDYIWRVGGYMLGVTVLQIVVTITAMINLNER